MITGDILRHKMLYFENASSNDPKIRYAPDFVVLKKVAARLSYLMQLYEKKYNATRRIKILSHHAATVEGNEDCIPHYHFDPTTNSSKHPSLEIISGLLVEHGLMEAHEAAQWRRCGFYSSVIGGTNLRVLMINTVIYSVESRPAANVSDVDPCGQFAWIANEVSNARAQNQRVVLVGHIIPDATKWVPQYLATFRRAVKSYSDVMVFQVFGHTHMFTFLTLSPETAPLIIDVPGITPRDGNVPAYLKLTFTDQIAPSRIVFANSEWTVDQIHSRFLDITQSSPSWQWGKTFPKDFPDMQSPLNTPNLYNYAKALNAAKHDSTTWLEFEQYYFGGVTQSRMSHKKKAEVTCRMFEYDVNGYKECAKSSG